MSAQQTARDQCGAFVAEGTRQTKGSSTTMNLQERAEQTVTDVKAAIPLSIDEDQTRRLTAIIETALVEMMRDCAKHHSAVVQECCPSDQDIAHKIAKQINLKTVAVIANLKGQR